MPHMRRGTMTSPTEPAAYFEAYWSQRYDAASSARRRRVLHLNYARHLPSSRDASILEIGPGFGEMIRYLSDRGYTNVHAVDNDPTLVAALSAQGFRGVSCVPDAVQYLQDRAAGFDCVIALHVLEHLDADGGRALLAAIRAALAPGGRIIVEVPNMANFITAPYARWSDYTHRHGYTRESLTASLRASGLDVSACFGVRRAVASVGELAAYAAQGITAAIAWALLKANYPRARIVAAPAIAAVGIRPADVSCR